MLGKRVILIKIHNYLTITGVVVGPEVVVGPAVGGPPEPPDPPDPPFPPPPPDGGVQSGLGVQPSGLVHDPIILLIFEPTVEARIIKEKAC